MKASIGLNCADPSLMEPTQRLSELLDLSFNPQAASQLYLSQQRLELRLEGFAPLAVDFTKPELWRRAAAGRQQALIRACRPDRYPHILDATAGWGRDAFLLAYFGAEVLMLEQNPVLWALLEDGLARFNTEALKLSKPSLLRANALEYLQDLPVEQYPDLIYLDPMHPERSKSALVKKEMQALQGLIGPTAEVPKLLDLALARAKYRVVLKWPARQPPLREATWSLAGKTLRFDVYQLG